MTQRITAAELAAQQETIPEGHNHPPPHPNCALYRELAEHGLKFNPNTDEIEVVRKPWDSRAVGEQDAEGFLRERTKP